LKHSDDHHNATANDTGTFHVSIDISEIRIRRVPNIRDEATYLQEVTQPEEGARNETKAEQEGKAPRKREREAKTERNRNSETQTQKEHKGNARMSKGETPQTSVECNSSRKIAERLQCRESNT
jgi:hypothetical protein